MALFRAVATVGGLTFVSRLAGFARDILMAAVLGAGPVADAFFVALKLPNVFRRITAEGAFSISFVPMFSGIEEKNGRKDAMQFAAEAQSVMFAIMVPFTVAMIWAMPFIIKIIAPGFADDPLRYDLAVTLSQMTFPYILLMSAVALYGGILNSFNRFAAFAVAPVFFNLTLIAALLFFTGMAETPAHALAVGVTVSGLIQLAWMLLNAWHFKLIISIDRPYFSARIKKLFRLMGPAAIGAGVVQINLVIDMILASFLEKGAISWLYYADRLYQLPLSVVGIAIGTALLPSLARKIKTGDDKGTRSLLRQGILFALVMSIPAAAALIALSGELMTTLFERGAFEHTDSLAAAAALNAYALSLPAFILIKVFSTFFFAGENTKTPVKLAIIATMANIIFGVLLIGVLGHVGIALATAIAAWIHLALLIRATRGKVAHIWQGTGIKTAKLITATILMIGAVLAFQHFMPADSDIMRILRLAVIVVGGVGIYFAALFVFRVFTVSDMKQLLRKTA